jgi:single-strand selective monofunctional uracil DNA glycosylase
MNKSQLMIKAARKLSRATDRLEFSGDTFCFYNPLEYASIPHEKYLTLYGGGRKRIIFLGMNPGPWGMAQTGIPFGEIEAARNWLGLESEVKKPAFEHPKRPVEGFSCRKSEVSGRRLWGLMKNRFGTPESFFRDHFVANYCPLSFMAQSGINITPDKLPAEEQKDLFSACDRHLREICGILEPEWIIGVGKFAEKRIAAALADDIKSGICRHASILHSSPASPAANSGWEEIATGQMRDLGLWQ